MAENKEENYEDKLQRETDAVASHNYMFMQNYKPMMEAWKKTHKPHDKMPVYKDKTGRYHWANRKQRRQTK